MSAPLIPESAPFDAEQRAWLNGFFAGWIGTSGDANHAANAATALLASGGPNRISKAMASGANGSPSPSNVASSAAGKSGTTTAIAEPDRPDPADVQADDIDSIEYPWHDPGLSLDERMAMAEEKPKMEKMMAAMAQLDCGACGYLCNSYAQAIATGETNDLTLCSPGGTETARTLKKVYREKDSGDATPTATKAKSKPAAKAAPGEEEDAGGISRRNPLRAKVLSVVNLNGEGSQKHTVHVEIDVSAGELEYRVGDSLGVFPTNDEELVEAILKQLRAHGTEHVVAANGIEATLRSALTSTANLKTVPDPLIEIVAAAATDDGERQAVLDLLENDEQLEDMDVLDLLRMASSAVVDVKAFSKALTKMQPRLYSIASSPKAHPGEVHLTIARVERTIGDRPRKGVASTMFSDRVEPGDTVQVFVHQAAGFTVPDDPDAPMIMVGPGTGVAPFRAFLEERDATGAKGKNWLFFGDQHEATDFLYHDQFQRMVERDVLTRLDTAFSRDQEKKVYVQDRMRESGAALFRWLDDGAYFFVCGDARRMAGDVDNALHEIVAVHGGMSDADAKGYIKKLKSEHRYVRDVY